MYTSIGGAIVILICVNVTLIVAHEQIPVTIIWGGTIDRICTANTQIEY